MMGHFVAFFASKEPPVEVDFLIELAKDGDVVPLEKALIEFFQVSENDMVKIQLVFNIAKNCILGPVR